MTVAILIDTDILIDASRKVDLAVDFIAAQECGSVPGISLITKLELLAGCRNKRELQVAERFLRRFVTVGLDGRVGDIAADLFRRYRLSHGLTRRTGHSPRPKRFPPVPRTRAAGWRLSPVRHVSDAPPRRTGHAPRPKRFPPAPRARAAGWRLRPVRHVSGAPPPGPASRPLTACIPWIPRRRYGHPGHGRATRCAARDRRHPTRRAA